MIQLDCFYLNLFQLNYLMMDVFMSPETEQQYKNKIAALKAELEKLKNQKTQEIKREKYGLYWIDVPEVFEKEAENKIPVLIEDKSKAIKNEDGKPTHILIEGDNYHALTCLNYTHAGKIDVIYIDPPYNTGSDGFTYKDARFLDKFPNGKPVPKDDPLRHSTWLSFMDKRLRLAKNLLSDKGVIFISIDDNEQANLKLLCDQIFGEKNFQDNIVWKRKRGKDNSTTGLSRLHEYLVIYSKIGSFTPNRLNMGEKRKSAYTNPDNDPKGSYVLQPCWASGMKKGPVYDLSMGNYTFTKRMWLYSKETIEKAFFENRISIKGLHKDGKPNVYLKVYLSENKGIIPDTIWNETGNTGDAVGEIKELFTNEIPFATPKPLKYIEQIIHIASTPTSTILDFFAGSGTTLHATMKLNAEDGGNRQCILVQQQENDANICETITYERNRRVIQGYTNAKNEEIAGLGNSLKYYKTDFIGENNAEKAGDEDKITLAQKAGYLISLVENTLEEIETNDFYQIFSDAEENQCTAIYFNGDTEKFPEFVYKIQEKNKKTTVYIFTWGSPDIFENEFDDLTNITIKSIPQPILEIYKSLMKNGEQ